MMGRNIKQEAEKRHDKEGAQMKQRLLLLLYGRTGAAESAPLSPSAGQVGNDRGVEAGKEELQP